MPAKSRFTRLDAFTKTVEDARIRTTSGGIVTIASLLVVLYLIWGEWSDYRQVVVLPELIVDKGRAERMEIHLNVTFPRIPCGLLTLDVLDISDEQQTGVVHGVSKVRLSPASEGGVPMERTSLELHPHNDPAKNVDPDYCGSCYSAPAPPNAQKAGCCNTCDEVREAYATNSWAFGRGDGVEQCEREGYGTALDTQRKEGCRIEGGLRVNKVAGNFHLAPGRSFSNGNMHVHDLNTYFDTPIEGGHTFSHQIHELHFGPKLPAGVVGQWTDLHHDNPLDATSQATDDTAFNYMYFIKVVSTSFIPLGWDVQSSSAFHTKSEEEAPLGSHGHVGHGPIETHQYSVTSHKRSIRGGNDAAEGHKERLHSQGGIPGVFFVYDISPMKVINREARPKTLTGFLAGICAIIGGTLTVAAAIDRGLYEGSSRLKKMHSQ